MLGKIIKTYFFVTSFPSYKHTFADSAILFGNVAMIAFTPEAAKRIHAGLITATETGICTLVIF